MSLLMCCETLNKLVPCYHFFEICSVRGSEEMAIAKTLFGTPVAARKDAESRMVKMVLKPPLA